MMELTNILGTSHDPVLNKYIFFIVIEIKVLLLFG